MFFIDSRDTLSFAREHAARIRGDAEPDLIGHAASKHRSLVHWLRWHACRCRIDAAPLAHRPA
jgi:hypothetical protein